LDSVTHFGQAVQHYEAELKNVEPGSESELKLLLECSFCYAHLQLQKGETLANEAIALAEKRKDNKRSAEGLCCKSLNQYRIGYSREAHASAERALSLFESL